MFRIQIALVLLIACSGASATDALILDLRTRLTNARIGDENIYLPADAPNAYLSAHWETKMARLGRLMGRCDREALALGVELLHTTNAEARGGLIYALELAMGACPEMLLPIVPVAHIKSLCAVAAYIEEHRAVTRAALIDRRIARLRKSPALASSPRGQACIDAYQSARRERD